ncbi:unnamed protein product [Pleuronectes platessa]|uniref:Uncharacterized protein n=1 Tax=Pleuronectes platessa TaxID=8262 RepID=A0A9N7Y602_PLEPL|nr:unnamed protein product [Pleuronectes platessa]
MKNGFHDGQMHVLYGSQGSGGRMPAAGTPLLDSSHHNPGIKHDHSTEASGDITNSCGLLTLVATQSNQPADTAAQRVHELNSINETMGSLEFWHSSSDSVDDDDDGRGG